MPDSFAFALASLAFQIASAVPYIRGILRKEVLPHPFSFLTWFVLAVVTFATLWQSGANWSLYPAGLYLALMAFYAYSGFRVIDRIKATRFDAACLVAALLAVPVSFSPVPWIATAMAIAVEAVAFMPSVRKTWQDPSTEYAFPWFVAALFPLCLFFSIGEPTFANSAYWVFLVAANVAFTSMIVMRRRHSARTKVSPAE